MDPGDGGRDGEKWTKWTKDKILDGSRGIEEGAKETEVLEMMPTSLA